MNLNMTGQWTEARDKKVVCIALRHRTRASQGIGDSGMGPEIACIVPRHEAAHHRALGRGMGVE